MKIDNINLGEVGYVLTAVFVVLKFAGEIDWSWWFVFSPLLALLAMTIVAIYISIKR